MADHRIALVITAAGSSSRMKAAGKAGYKKEYQVLPGRTDGAGNPLTVLGATLLGFAGLADPIVITYPEGKREDVVRALPGNPSSLERGWASAGSSAESHPTVILVPGGKTRQESVYQGLLALVPTVPDYVLIHDGARPFISRELIQRVIDGMVTYGAAIPGCEPAETPKEMTGDGFIGRHLRRSTVMLAQTPQGFAFAELLDAYREALRRDLSLYTDDAEVWGINGRPIAVVPGERENRKITWPEDLNAETVGALNAPRIRPGIT